MKGPSLYSSIIWGLLALIISVFYIIDYLHSDLDSYSDLSPIPGTFVVALLCLFSVHLIIFINVLYSKKYYYEVLDNSFWVLELLIMIVFMITSCITFYNAISVDALSIVLSIVQFIIQMLNYTLLCVWISNNDRCYQDSDTEQEKSILESDKRLLFIFGIVAFALILSFTIVGILRKNDSERFVGKWESSNGHQIIE